MTKWPIMPGMSDAADDARRALYFKAMREFEAEVRGYIAAHQAFASRGGTRTVDAPVIGERTGAAEIDTGHYYGFALDAAHGVDERRGHRALLFGQRHGGQRDGLRAARRSDDDIRAEAAELHAHFAFDVGVNGEQRRGQGGGDSQGGEGQGEAALAELDGAEDKGPEHHSPPRRVTAGSSISARRKGCAAPAIEASTAAPTTTGPSMAGVSSEV